nr:unnamed protein product [Naegleria fowleri]
MSAVRRRLDMELWRTKQLYWKKRCSLSHVHTTQKKKTMSFDTAENAYCTMVGEEFMSSDRIQSNCLLHTCTHFILSSTIESGLFLSIGRSLRHIPLKLQVGVHFIIFWILYSTCPNHLSAFVFTALTLAFCLVAAYLNSIMTDLENTNAKLLVTLQNRKQLFSHISHQFQTACTASVGGVELLKYSLLNQEMNQSSHQEFMHMLESCNNCLLSFAEEILHHVQEEHDMISSIRPM